MLVTFFEHLYSAVQRKERSKLGASAQSESGILQRYTFSLGQ